jgi:hypothetical protein
MRAKKGRFAVAVSVWLLGSIAVGFIGDFHHTDDGCVIETHCIACQRGIQSIGVIGPILALPPALEPLGIVPTPPASGIARNTIPGEDPRGPPQA